MPLRHSQYVGRGPIGRFQPALFRKAAHTSLHTWAIHIVQELALWPDSQNELDARDLLEEFRLRAIVTEVGGLPETVRDGETGVVVSPNNPEQLAGVSDVAESRANALCRKTTAQLGRLKDRGHQFIFESASNTEEDLEL